MNENSSDFIMLKNKVVSWSVESSSDDEVVLKEMVLLHVHYFKCFVMYFSSVSSNLCFFPPNHWRTTAFTCAVVVTEIFSVTILFGQNRNTGSVGHKIIMSIFRELLRHGSRVSDGFPSLLLILFNPSVCLNKWHCFSELRLRFSPGLLHHC